MTSYEFNHHTTTSPHNLIVQKLDSSFLIYYGATTLSVAYKEYMDAKLVIGTDIKIYIYKNDVYKSKIDIYIDYENLQFRCFGNNAEVNFDYDTVNFHDVSVKIINSETQNIQLLNQKSVSLDPVELFSYRHDYIFKLVEIDLNTNIQYFIDSDILSTLDRLLYTQNDDDNDEIYNLFQDRNFLTELDYGKLEEYKHELEALKQLSLEEILNRFDMSCVSYNDELGKCLVCVCDFEPNDVILCTECNHKFHKDCLKDLFLNYFDKCILCNTPILQKFGFIFTKHDEIVDKIDQIRHVVPHDYMIQKFLDERDLLDGYIKLISDLF